MLEIPWFYEPRWNGSLQGITHHPPLPVPAERFWFVQCDFCDAAMNTDALRGGYRVSTKTGAWCCGGCTQWEACRDWYHRQAPWRSIASLLELVEAGELRVEMLPAPEWSTKQALDKKASVC